MLIGNIMIDRRMDDQEVSSILSKMLPVSPGDVCFYSKLQDLRNADLSGKVIVEHWPLRGDFRDYLDFNVVDDAAIRKLEGQTPTSFFREFCRLTGCTGLISNADINP